MFESTGCICKRKISENRYGKTLSQKPLEAISVSNGVNEGSVVKFGE
jgi:hypothetical protein